MPLEVATPLAASAEPGDETAIRTLSQAADAPDTTDPGLPLTLVGGPRPRAPRSSIAQVTRGPNRRSCPPGLEDARAQACRSRWAAAMLSNCDLQRLVDPVKDSECVADFVNHFAADVDPFRAKIMYAVQQALAGSASTDVIGVPAWKSLPSWYLVRQRSGDPTRRRAPVRQAHARNHDRSPVESRGDGLPSG